MYTETNLFYYFTKEDNSEFVAKVTGKGGIAWLAYEIGKLDIDHRKSLYTTVTYRAIRDIRGGSFRHKGFEYIEMMADAIHDMPRFLSNGLNKFDDFHFWSTVNDCGVLDTMCRYVIYSMIMDLKDLQ